MTDTKGWDDSRKRAGAKERKRPPESRKSKDTDSPTEPPNGARPAYTLTIAEWNCEGMNLCCFKPLHLYWFVTLAVDNQYM